MKKHVNIPVFIPHFGCPNDCVFCNQKAITARTAPPTPAEAEETINRNLATIKENPNINCYIGFDFGFFCGCNIYYFQENKLANDIYKAFKDNNLKVRLFTNIDYNFDVIILLGYTNLKCEKRYLRKNKNIIMKALSFLSI